MDIRFIDSTEPTDLMVLPVFTDGKKLGRIDHRHENLIIQAASNAPNFKGRAGETLLLTGINTKSGYKNIMLLGMGKPDALTAKSAETLGSTLFKAIKASGYKSAIVHGVDVPELPMQDAVAAMASGMALKSYAFEKYKTKKSDPVTVAFLTADPAAAEAAFAPKREVIAGCELARDVMNEPGNVIYPSSLARIISEELGPLGVRVTVFDEHDLEHKLKAGGIIAVGKGSVKAPRMVVMEYAPPHLSSFTPEIALVGKGITFDTGGISLKQSSGMGDMKHDMGGAAAVVGAMRALAGRKANTQVVAIVALAENMPDGRATRPGDIITSMNGKTVEIDNTDAEGRLVLMDAMTYVQRTYKPKVMVDLATLTGAVRTALGSAMAGICSNSTSLCRKIERAGKAVQEDVWRLPLHESFTRAMQGSKYADLINSNPSAGAGSSTAAAFLQEFVEADVKWAHLDIAAVAFNKTGHPFLPDGIGNGFGVRLLDQLIRDHYEDQGPQPGRASIAPCGTVCDGSCSNHPQTPQP